MVRKNIKIYGFFTVVIVVMTMVFNYLPILHVAAKTLQELNQELEYSKRKMDNLYNQVQEYQEKINAAKLEINSLEDELDNLSKNIDETDEVIKDTIYRVDAKKKSINKISKDIVKQSIELEKQKEILTSIVQEMYTASEIGKTDLLEILLYAGNFKEALNDVEYLDILHDQGEKSMRSIETLRREMEGQRVVIEKENESLNLLLSSLEKSKIVLKEHEEAKQMLLEKTQGEESKYQELKVEAQEAQKRMNSRLSEIEDEISKEKERLARMSRVSLKNGGLLWPVTGRITTYFQDPTYPFIHILGQHNGLDIAAPKGTVVQAAHGGIVTIGYNPGGYGNYVLITAPSQDGGLVTSLYGHLSKIYLSSGTDIKAGDAIGEIGSTGFSTGPHLHFEVRMDKKPVNPLVYLP